MVYKQKIKRKSLFGRIEIILPNKIMIVGSDKF